MFNKLFLSTFFFLFMGLISPMFGQIPDSSIVSKSDTLKAVKGKTPDFLKNLVEELKNQQKTTKSTDVFLEIDGLLIDDTKTKGGRDFYDLFYRDWVAPPDAKNYSIFIVEKPFRLNQTTIEILINDILVFQGFLQPRTDFIEDLALQSIGMTQQYLLQYEELAKQLDGDEKRGTGIF